MGNLSIRTKIRLAIGILGGGVHPMGLLLLAIVAATHLAFVASLGLYLSVAIPGTGRATLIGLVMLFVACVAPLMIWPGGVGLIPPVAWVLCVPRTFEAGGWLDDPAVIMSLPLGVIAYTAFGGMFWLLAVRRFQRQADGAAAVAA